MQWAVKNITGRGGVEYFRGGGEGLDFAKYYYQNLNNLKLEYNMIYVVFQVQIRPLNLIYRVFFF